VGVRVSVVVETDEIAGASVGTTMLPSTDNVPVAAVTPFPSILPVPHNRNNPKQ